MRVVFDTNVVVSALLFRGVTSRIHLMWKMKLFTPLVSKPVLDEYIRVLGSPRFKLEEAEIDALVKDELLQNSSVVKVTTEIKEIHEDPADDMFLALAIDGHADRIVSGDTHLLDLGSFRNIPIQTVRNFLDSFPDSQ